MVKVLKTNIKALAPIVGVIIMICLLFLASIIVGSVFYVYYQAPEAPPMANIDVEGGDLTSLKISHAGGDSLTLSKDVRVLLLAEGETYELETSSLGEFEPGDEIKIELVDKYGNPITSISSGDTVTLKIVSSDDTVLMEEKITIVADDNSSSGGSSSSDDDDDSEDEEVVETEVVNETVLFDFANASGTVVMLLDSTGSPLSGGSVMYYDDGWQYFGVTNSSGAAVMPLDNGTFTFRMTYLSASCNIRQDISLDNVVTFRTSPITVRLLDSSGSVIDTDDSLVKYYSGGWQDFGTTTDGTVTKELFLRKYSFRMIYDEASNYKVQDVVNNSTVDFQTVSVTASLLDSSGSLIGTDDAKAMYYSSGWKEMGMTTGGVVSKELLPRKYSFRMIYDNSSVYKTQDTINDSNVNFQTTPVTVDLLDSTGNLIDTEDAAVMYYSAGWKDFGTTSSGSVSRELLPRKYSFRLTYDNTSAYMVQDIRNDSIVDFQTSLVTVNLLDSEGSILETDDSLVKYYSGGWKDFGITTDGVVTKELLPRKYSFRLVYDNASAYKVQDIRNDSSVDFQTTLVTVSLLDSTGSVLDTDDSLVRYYSGGWKVLGTTLDGAASKELLPRKYSFSLTYENSSAYLSQDVTNDSNVNFQTTLATIRLLDSTGSVLETDSALAKFYSGGWQTIGYADDGTISKELLPKNYTFNLNYKSKSINKIQNIGSDNVIDFATGEVVCDSGICTSYYSGGWQSFSNGEQLLPGNYTFRFNDGTPNTVITIVSGETTNVDDYV